MITLEVAFTDIVLMNAGTVSILLLQKFHFLKNLSQNFEEERLVNLGDWFCKGFSPISEVLTISSTMIQSLKLLICCSSSF